MAWSSTIYSFLQTTTVSPGFKFTFDALLNYADPGVVFNGTEPNAVYSVVREIAGDLWFAQNADWNGTNWIPENVSLPVALTVFRSTTGSYPSYLQKYVIGAGVNPAVPGSGNLILQITGTGQFTVAGINRGTATGMLADGSTNTLTYTSWGGTAFATATDQIFIQVVDSSAATGYFAPNIISKTRTGVTFQIAGGTNGQTVTIDFIAYGH